VDQAHQPPGVDQGPGVRGGRIEPRTKGGIPTKKLDLTVISAAILFLCAGPAAAGGLWGPPQSVSREGGGLHTGIGYGYDQDRYQNDTEHVIRQNQVFSHLGYGARNWELYGRLGVSELKISDAFRSSQSSTTTSKNDFKDQWMLFGTLGAKGFYPFHQNFGIGAFVQGTYFFNDFSDQVSGTQNGVPFSTELKVKNFWDVNFGLGFQAAIPKQIKLYLGPYIYYSELKTSPSAHIPGLELSARDMTLKNKTLGGGFAGVDVPLAKGFHLNVEGKYSRMLSVGAAVTYSY